MRSTLVASVNALFVATLALSGCASAPQGTDEGGSAVSAIEDEPSLQSLAGDYRPADGGYPRLTLEADGSYVYDTGIRCFRAPCPSGDAGTWQLDTSGSVRLVATSPDALEPQRFVDIVSNAPLTLMVEDTSGVAHALTKFVEPTLVGDYRPADGGYPRLTLEADGSYVYDTGIRCFRAPCPSGDAGTWQATSDDAVRLVAVAADGVQLPRLVAIVASDPLTLAVEDASGEMHDLTQFVEAPLPVDCTAVLCAPSTRCEVIDGAAQCVL